MHTVIRDVSNVLFVRNYDEKFSIKWKNVIWKGIFKTHINTIMLKERITS